MLVTNIKSGGLGNKFLKVGFKIVTKCKFFGEKNSLFSCDFYENIAGEMGLSTLRQC